MFSEFVKETMITLAEQEEEDAVFFNENDEKKFFLRSASPRGSMRRRPGVPTAAENRELERGENFFQNNDHKEALQADQGLESQNQNAANNLRKIMLMGKVVRTMKEESYKRRESLAASKIVGTGKRRERAQNLQNAILRRSFQDIKLLPVSTEDINAPDEYGKTSLHYACLAKNPDILQYLLQRKPNVHALDDREDTPLHTAIRTGDVNIIAVLLSEDRVDVNFSGSSNATPLHIAVHEDNPHIVRIFKMLLMKGADIYARDSSKKTAIALAVLKGYHEIMRCILQHAKNLHLDLNKLLYDVDSRGSSLLHLAVYSRVTEAAQVCLEFGAQVDKQRAADGTTALHLACSNGPFEVLQYLLKSVSFIVNYSLQDNNGMTCLHRAAKYNHAKTIRFLLDQGIDCNPRDSCQRTPLLLAASRDCTEVVEALLEYGADVNARDKHDRTVLHCAVGDSETLQVLFKDPRVIQLIKNKDENGLTALHYAARMGYHKDASALVQAVKDLPTLKNDDGQSPLHLAASNGWIEVVQILLEGENARMANAVDSNERTPLHLTAKKGHEDVVDFLLQKGAGMERDRKGHTALHLAAFYGSLPCVELIVEANPSSMNMLDENQETALHLAAKGGHAHIVSYLLSHKDQDVSVNSLNQNILDMAIEHQHTDVAMALAEHTRWKAFLRSTNRGVRSQMDLLAEKMPQVAEKFLDRCVRKEGKPDAKDYKIYYDLRFLQGMPYDENEGFQLKQSLKPLYTMVKFGRLNCLTHPACYALINSKWRKYGLKVILFNQIITFLYLASVLGLVASLEDNPCFGKYEQSNCTSGVSMFSASFDGGTDWPKRPSWSGFYVFRIILTLLSALKLTLHLAYIYLERWKYFKSSDNVLEIMLCVTMLVFLIPGNCRWCFGAGAISACLAWINLIVRVSKVTSLGIYVMMLIKILSTVLQIIVLLGLFLVAFAFPFYVIDSQHRLFASIPQAIISTFVMMLGDISYSKIFINRSREIEYAGIEYPLYILFCVTMPIIFLNVLIGLAVGDIDQIRQKAALEGHAKQIELLYDVEKTAPDFVLKRWQLREHIETPNQTRTMKDKVYDLLVGTVSEHARKGGEEKLENEEERKVKQNEKRLNEISADIDGQADQMEDMMLMLNRVEETLGIEETALEIPTISISWV